MSIKTLKSEAEAQGLELRHHSQALSKDEDFTKVVKPFDFCERIGGIVDGFTYYNDYYLYPTKIKRDCKKCGLPEHMFWCPTCESNSESAVCDDCGAGIEVDSGYHGDCMPWENNTCDRCDVEMESTDLIWINDESFTPKEGEVLKPQAIEMYQALCESCYQSELIK